MENNYTLLISTHSLTEEEYENRRNLSPRNKMFYQYNKV